MTPKRTPENAAGLAIAARMAYLGLSGPQVNDLTNGAIYPKLLSRIRTGKKGAGTLRMSEYAALARVLKWTAEEFAAATGVSMPASDLPNSDTYERNLDLPSYGTVSAGLLASPIEDEFADRMTIDKSLPGIRGRDVRKLRIMRVNGDSMVSPKAAESVPNGAYIVVEAGAIPQDSDLVVAWLSEQETAVIKQYREEGEVILRSYNPHGPVFRSSGVEFDVRGVVRWIMRAP